MRDHLGDALYNMRFPSRVWEPSFFSSSGFYINYIYFTHMLELFAHAGFQVSVSEIKRWLHIPTPPSKLAPEFRSLGDEDLRFSQFDVALR